MFSIFYATEYTSQKTHTSGVKSHKNIMLDYLYFQGCGKYRNMFMHKFPACLNIKLSQTLIIVSIS